MGESTRVHTKIAAYNQVLSKKTRNFIAKLSSLRARRWPKRVNSVTFILLVEMDFPSGGHESSEVYVRSDSTF